jgi:hypothetical protein
MATLADQDRIDVWADIMRRLSADREPVSITKAELRAAIDAIDDWVHTNAAAFNTAIPQPARGALTAPQKARLLMLVVSKRFEKGT